MWGCCRATTCDAAMIDRPPSMCCPKSEIRFMDAYTLLHNNNGSSIGILHSYCQYPMTMHQQ